MENEYGNMMPMPTALTQKFSTDDRKDDDIWKWLLLSGGIGGYGVGGRGGRGGYSDADSPVNQNVESLRSQVMQNTTAGQFEGLTNQIASFQAAVNNGMSQSTLATNAQFQNLCTQIAACCCENRVATERINTTIALTAKDQQAQMLNCCCDIKEAIGGVNTNLALHGKDVEKAICDQTHMLGVQATSNTTQILDHIAGNERSRLEQEAANLRTQVIIAGQTHDSDAQFSQVNLTLLAIQNELKDNGHH